MKELLEALSKGEKTVEDVLKAIDEADKEKVPRSRLNDKIAEVKDLKEQLKERDAQLDDLKTKAAGNEELTKQINDLKEQNKKATEEYQAKLDKQAFDFALERKLAGEKARNPKAVKALLNLDNIKLDGENLIGLDDQLKAIKESDGYLFDDQPAGGTGANPVGGGTTRKNPWKKETFNLTEQAKILQENPTLAAQLKAAAN